MTLKETSTEALETELYLRRKAKREEEKKEKKEIRFLVSYTNCNNAHDAGWQETDDLPEAKRWAVNPNGYYEAEIYDREVGRAIFASRPQLSFSLYEIREGVCPDCGRAEDKKEDKDGNMYDYHTVPCTACDKNT